MIIIIMGVAGSGKTTIAQLLAAKLNWEFHDADEFHPAGNIDKMSRGVPLTDEDRTPWLQAMRRAIERWLKQEKNMVLTCSCLKSAYREQLWVDREQVRWVYLKGSFELIAKRLTERAHHFMKVNLLRSQFEILEEPVEAVTVDIADPPEAIVKRIRERLGL